MKMLLAVLLAVACIPPLERPTDPSPTPGKPPAVRLKFVRAYQEGCVFNVEWALHGKGTITAVSGVLHHHGDTPIDKFPAQYHVGVEIKKQYVALITASPKTCGRAPASMDVHFEIDNAYVVSGRW